MTGKVLGHTTAQQLPKYIVLSIIRDNAGEGMHE
jgi:hypothetical protein